MAGRLTRFLNLERARKPGDTPAHGVVSRERFSGESPPQAPPDDPFRAERAAQLDSGVEIDAHPDSEQPFLRCPVCESDNSKFAVKCINCQGRLDTEEVHQWNARLWAVRQKARALEPRPPPAVDQQRLLGEAIARRIAETEGARLRLDDRTPLGLRLLQWIPDPNVRFAVAMGMVVTFFGAGIAVYVAKGHTLLQAVGAIVAGSLFVLFMPRSGSRRSRWWDDDL